VATSTAAALKAGKSGDLKRRLWFLVFALVVYRLGTYIPLPGIDPEAFANSFFGQSKGMLELFNMFAGGAVQRMAIFALNIMPYISASIIIQLLTSVVPTLESLKKEGESGRKVINQYTRYLTVFLAVFQAYGIAIGLEGQGGTVADPGWFFRVSTVITLVGGTMFLMWLGEQITARGIGNGSSLIIFAGIVAAFPSAIVGLLELGRQGAVSTFLILVVAVMSLLVVAFIVFMERAQRRHSADFRLLTAAVADDSREFLANGGDGRRARLDHDLARPRAPAVHAHLCRADRLLRVLLYRDRVQSDGDRGQSQEARRLPAGHTPGREYREIHRLGANAHHLHRRGLSFADLSLAGNPDRAGEPALLLRRDVAAHRRQRHHGYRRAGAWALAGAAI